MKLKQNVYDAIVSVVEKKMHTGECMKILTEEFHELRPLLALNHQHKLYFTQDP